MDISSIPKVFWYSLSISLLSLTTGLTISSIRATEFSVEVANSKINITQDRINLSKNINSVQRINQDLKIKVEDLEQVNNAYKELQQKYNKLLNSKKTSATQELRELKPNIQKFQTQVKKIDNENLKEELRQNEEKLEAINEQM